MEKRKASDVLFGEALRLSEVEQKQRDDGTPTVSQARRSSMSAAADDEPQFVFGESLEPVTAVKDETEATSGVGR